MKKFFCGLLSLAILTGLLAPCCVDAAIPETVVVDPLNYDLSKTTWYSDAALETPVTVDLTKGKSDWTIPDGVCKFTQERYKNGTVSDHGVLSIRNVYASSPILQTDVPEVKADGWYDISYFIGGSEGFSWHSSAEFYLTKKNDAEYKKTVSQYIPGALSGSAATRVSQVGNKDGVWKITGDKVYIEAGSDYVMNIKLGKGYSLAANQYRLLISEITLSPTVAATVSTSKETVLEYEDYAGYNSEERTNASGGKLIREKTAVQMNASTPYVIEMPINITKAGSYNWKAVMSTKANNTYVSKMTVAVDGNTLADNTSAGTDSEIETWTAEVTFDIDIYGGTTELSVGEHIITTTIENRASNSNAAIIGFAADYFSLEPVDKDIDISKPVDISGETTIEAENYASLVTYFNDNWGSSAAHESASGGRLLCVNGGVVPSPDTTAKYEIPINVTKAGYYDTEFWVSSMGQFYAHSLLNFILDGENIGDANGTNGASAKYSYSGKSVYAFKGSTVYLEEGEHKIGFVAEKCTNSGTITFNADCIKLIPTESVAIGDEKVTFDFADYNNTAVSSLDSDKILYSNWYFANADTYKINIPISTQEGYYDFETVLTMNGVYISPINIKVDGDVIITNMDDGTFVKSINTTFHLAKYNKTVKLESGNHLITLTVNVAQTNTASGSASSFPLELMKYGADYISVKKSDKDIFEQTENGVYMNKNFDALTSGNVFAALYKNNNLVDIQKKVIENANTAEFNFENVSQNDYDGAKIFAWNAEYAPVAEPTNHEFMPINENPFENDNEINVVYLGDSLYEASGIASDKNFISLTGEWFKEKFGNDETTVNYYNKGYGSTTSGYSVVRLARDVAAYDADVVFVALTINDGNSDTRRNFETIIKTLQSLEKSPYIIFTVFPNSGKQVNATFGKEIARTYGIPVIDGTAAFDNAIEDGYTMSSLYMDGVHPNAVGHGYIADYIISLLETNRYWSKGINPGKQLVENSKTLDIDSMDYFLSSSDKVEKSSGWTVDDGYVTSTAAGDVLTFKFNGSLLGFEYGQMATSGDIEIWVDGVKVKTCSTTYAGISNYFFVCTDKSVYLDLEKCEHTVELKTAANSSGVNNRIYGIFTGDYK